LAGPTPVVSHPQPLPTSPAAGAPLPAVRLPHGRAGGNVHPYLPHGAVLLRPRYVPHVVLQRWGKSESGRISGRRFRHAAVATIPADFPLHDRSPYSYEHVRRESVGFVHPSRAILCRAVPNPKFDSQLLHRGTLWRQDLRQQDAGTERFEAGASLVRVVRGACCRLGGVADVDALGQRGVHSPCP
jgi:hypothetical protein